MKVLYQFVHYDNQDCKHHLEEQVSNYLKDVCHRIRMKAKAYLDNHPNDYVLATCCFFPSIVTYKLYLEPFTGRLLHKHLKCDLF